MSEASGASRIEGGLDAIVVGGGLDGLVAAAYLARAGRKTVLLEGEGELGGAHRPLADDPFKGAIPGEHLVYSLHPKMIDDLGLYRHGLAYAARRMGTAYFFSDGESLQLDGELRVGAAALDKGDGAAPRLFDAVLDAAAALRPIVAGVLGEARQGALEAAVAAAPGDLRSGLEALLVHSADDVLAQFSVDDALTRALLAEASFRNGAPPHAPFSFSPLLARWSGETAGLQGACAYPAGGVGAVLDALRRAAQRAHVDIRTAQRVARILVEKDCAAGVVLESGDQLRAPIVVSALDAQRTYLSLIGPAHLDSAFQNALARRRARVGAAHLRLALAGAPLDDATRANMARRVVFAPEPAALRRAFAVAGDGAVPADFVIEAVFENAHDDAAPADRQTLSVLAHPAPIDAGDKTDHEKALRNAIVARLDQIVPGLDQRLETERLTTPAAMAARWGAQSAAHGARDGVLRQMALAAAAVSAGGVGGLFFCGPEAQIGYGFNGVAGYAAAAGALRGARRGSATA